MIVIAEDSVRFAHSGPSHNLLRPAIAELVSCWPLCPRLVNEGPSDISYRVAKRSSDRTLARRPCLQVSRWHPSVASRSSDLSRSGHLSMIMPVFGTATLPTGVSVASSRDKGGLLTRLWHSDPAHRCLGGILAWRRGLLTGLWHGDPAYKYLRAIPA